MLDVVIGKSRHRIVRVVVVRLVAHLHTIHSGLLGSGFEVLREELALLVEVVAGTLSRRMSKDVFLEHWQKD